jgi:hypothetical protein
MKRDAEVTLAIRERGKGKTQEQAAARAGMSPKTLRKYELAGKLPSELREPREYRTRPDPFEGDWAWVECQLGRDPALQATTLFELLCERSPGKYGPTQLRTLQRRIAAWRAQKGPEREVIFEQVHKPGGMAQSDFTSMDELGVTIGGAPFPHMLFHLVLVYSNVEAVHVCPSESFESLAEGIERCLWRVGGVPDEHRTDHLGAAVRRLDRGAREDWTARYRALMSHYGMTPTTNNAGEAHENGDVEQSHHRFKVALDQKLRVRGSRDFDTRQAYTSFLDDVVKKRNHTRQARFLEEQQHLKPLPVVPLLPSKELRVRVSRFSTIRVLENTYSVPSRLIGSLLTVRVRAEQLELYQGTAKLDTLPRLVGKGGRSIDYRHLSWSLVRKPGAFANYRYRDELFPTLEFRKAYDRLRESVPARADREYVRLLHLAASTSEVEVETALSLLLEEHRLPSFDAVRELVREPSIQVPYIRPALLDFGVYDRLIGGAG